MISKLFSRPIKQLLITMILAGSLVACGASTILSAGISGTGIVVGVLTGFGSIFVNGVEYDVDTAEFEIDGQPFDDAAVAQSNLAVGMVVRLEATDNGDGTGTAVRVVYDDSVEGPIQSMPSQVGNDPNLLEFTVLGHTVRVDQFETSFDDTSFDQLDVNQVVEISGFVDGANRIVATRVEYKSDFQPGSTVVEIRGTVENLSVDRFDLGGFSVGFDGNTELKDVTSLTDGLNVEVKGVYQASGTIQATKIEAEEGTEEELSGSEGNVELQGVIYSFISASEFFVNGVPVDASGLSASAQGALADGAEVEVKGQMNGDGVLVAESIEFRGAEAEMKARITGVDIAQDGITVDFGDSSPELQLQVTAESLLKDDRDSAPTEAIRLAQLSAALNTDGPIEANISIRKQATDWVVVKLKLKGSVDEYEIEGVVEAVDSMSVPMTLTLFGAKLPLEGIGTSVLDALVPDSSRVELKDRDKDGDFDELDVEEDD